VASAFNAALERLEHAVGEMRQFSAALAHELRTPLAALRGEIELGSREPGLSEAARGAAASQLEEIDRLARLIDQILTQARAEAGQIHLTFAPVNLGELASGVVQDLESLADARSIGLGCEHAETVVVSGDAGWLRRLLINLVDNAIKFTPESGRITVRVTAHGETATIAVEDTGIGLTEEDAARVFERFFRADPSRTSRIEGAGLGLSLVQWVAAQHHGTVSVASRPGAGTTFTVTLPRAT
jgi:two-component system, OmpR family, sensor kinase